VTAEPNPQASAVFFHRAMCLLLAGGLAAAAGVMTFSTLQMTGPFLPIPAVRYGLIAFAVVLLLANLFVVPRLAVRWQTPASPASVPKAATGEAAMDPLEILPAGLLFLSGLLLAIGFMLSASWWVLAPVPIFILKLIFMSQARVTR
jgi:hypothetical protein